MRFAKQILRTAGFMKNFHGITACSVYLKSGLVGERLTGEKNNTSSWQGCFDSRREFQTAFARKREITKYDVRPETLGVLECFRGGVVGFAFKPVSVEDERKSIGNHLIVINDQNTSFMRSPRPE